MKAKRNLLIIGSTQGKYGGIEAFMIAVAKAASSWPEFNVKMCFKLVKGSEVGEDLTNQASQSSIEPFFVKRCSVELFKLVRWADRIHVQNVPPDIVVPAYIFSKKIFSTIHNRKTGSNSVHNLLWSITIKLVNQRWYNSNFVRESWESNKRNKKSATIPTVSILSKTWCEPHKRQGFIFVGRWISNKGIEELLKAYALNDFSTDAYPLTILGDGPLRPSILKLIKELSLNNVSLPGFVDDDLKAQYISQARWLIAASKTFEDLGLTPIEARSVGVPSIVTRDGGLPEAAGESALIAEPGNVEDLARSMRIAADMKEEEYVYRSELAYRSLKNFLKPIEFYRLAFNN